MLPLTPTRLGRYEIVDEIGKGAMGVVYLARDPLIGRLVALKTFRIGYSVKDQEMEQFRIRFMREAQSAGILTHPNIVTIHDVVEASEEGLAFIAMEYVRGTNLKLMLQGDRPLTLPFVLEIVSQVGDALDYAHSNRVIHRDVKPANILITTENRVKITDFGIARLDSSNLTQEGQLLGTPNYMAPEQIQGKDVDYRTDLFSLGVVLYEMLTRHKPFQGENLTVVSHRIVYDHFTPLREYIEDLPPGIDRILAKALEKDPARRYQRAREMVDDLRRLVEASAARDGLNETQSLSTTLVLPPAAVPPLPQRPKLTLLNRWRKRPTPPPPLPPAEAETQGSLSPPLPEPVAAAIAASSLPPPPVAASPEDTMATQAPAAPLPSPTSLAGRLSPRYLAMGAGAAVLLAVLLGAAVLLWRSWSQPAPAPPPRTAAEAQRRMEQIAALVSQGHQKMRQGDFEGGVALYRQAELLDPGDPKLRKQLRDLREMAENQVEAYSTVRKQEKDLADRVQKAKQLLAAKRYDLAIKQAEAVLFEDPANEDAKKVQAEAQKAQATARRAFERGGPASPATARPGEQVATTTPSAGEAPPGGPGESTGAQARTFSLQVHFQADMDASLIVRADGREVLRKNFESGGLFRKTRGHNFTQPVEIPVGSQIVVHVTPKRKGADIQRFDGNFPGGTSHRLEIYVSDSAKVSAHVI
jgi:serine/threonine protein kinase